MVCTLYITQCTFFSVLHPSFIIKDYIICVLQLTACLQEARRHHSLTDMQGGVLVAAGGRDNLDNSGRLKSVELFDTAWTTVDWSLQEEVEDHCAVALSDEELVILGGYINRKALRFGNILLKSNSFLCQFIFYIENKVLSYFIQRL